MTEKLDRAIYEGVHLASMFAYPAVSGGSCHTKLDTKQATKYLAQYILSFTSNKPWERYVEALEVLESLETLGPYLRAIAKEMKSNFDLDVDMDEVIAGGLCHDLGKPFEFDANNQARWKANPGITGCPSIRHTVYGVHIALTAGLPEKIAHIAGAHSREGEHVQRSLVGEIVPL